MTKTLLQLMRFSTLGLGSMFLFGTMSAHAGLIGYCFIEQSDCSSPDDLSTTNAQNAITTSGNTFEALSNLDAGSLTGLNVLWLLNGSNDGYGDVYNNNLNAITNWILAGGVLSLHDRAVDVGTANILPGGSGITFVRDLNSDLNVQTGGTLVTNGPGGVVDDTTLDGGSSSDHGGAILGTLPAGAVAILSNADGNITDFSYRLSAGAVYYSAIPMDYYLEGSESPGVGDSFVNIYAPNELAYQASLAGDVAETPEPGSIVLLSGGLAGLLLLRRKTARS